MEKVSPLWLLYSIRRRWRHFLFASQTSMIVEERIKYDWGWLCLPCYRRKKSILHVQLWVSLLHCCDTFLLPCSGLSVLMHIMFLLVMNKENYTGKSLFKLCFPACICGSTRIHRCSRSHWPESLIRDVVWVSVCKQTSLALYVSSKSFWCALSKIKLSQLEIGQTPLIKLQQPWKSYCCFIWFVYEMLVCS